MTDWNRSVLGRAEALGETGTLGYFLGMRSELP